MIKRCTTSFLIAFAVMLVSACSSMAPENNFTKASLAMGKDNFNAQHYSTAFIQLMPYAVRGYRDAEYAVGYMYYYGQGVGENEEIGSSWLCRAKKQGQLEAVSLLQQLPQVDCTAELAVLPKQHIRKSSHH